MNIHEGNGYILVIPMMATVNDPEKFSGLFLNSGF